jgi:hypothetical protein
MQFQHFVADLIGGVFGSFVMASEIQIYLDGMNARYPLDLIQSLKHPFIFGYDDPNVRPGRFGTRTTPSFVRTINPSASRRDTI